MLEALVDLLAIADEHNEYNQSLILDPLDHAVVRRVNTKKPRPASDVLAGRGRRSVVRASMQVRTLV